MSFERLSLSIMTDTCPIETRTLADLDVLFTSDVELLAMDFQHIFGIELDTDKLSPSTSIADLRQQARSLL